MSSAFEMELKIRPVDVAPCGASGGADKHEYVAELEFTDPDPRNTGETPTKRAHFKLDHRRLDPGDFPARPGQTIGIVPKPEYRPFGHRSRR